MSGQVLLTKGWAELGPNWPPYFCPRCWGTMFYYNTSMAQCVFCGHIILNWGKHGNPGSLADHS